MRLRELEISSISRPKNLQPQHKFIWPERIGRIGARAAPELADVVVGKRRLLIQSLNRGDRLPVTSAPGNGLTSIEC
jgi:hypothetical protein